jgi:ubiquinone/menaquinone biosynthesis C-methylase UbiE
MHYEKKETSKNYSLETSRFAYWVILMIHENPLLQLLRKPNKLLKAAGIKEDQTILEVGCGPGSFTLPAAGIVGDKGKVYAIDIQPRFTARVQKKAQKKAIKNIETMCVNAANTSLQDESMDLAFIFGLRHIAGGMEKTVSELHRVLKPFGKLSFEKTNSDERELIEQVCKNGFTYNGRQGRIYLFTKKGE